MKARRAIVRAWLALALGGCAAEVAAPAMRSERVAAEPAPSVRWIETPIYLDASEEGSLHDPERAALAELAAQVRQRDAIELRLYTTVAARSSCLVGLEPGQYAREEEIEDGSFDVFYAFDPRAYLEAIIAELEAHGVHRDRIETSIDPRIRQGPPTEHARLRVRFALGVPAPAGD